jgi:GTP cyclohydrolase IA
MKSAKAVVKFIEAKRPEVVSHEGLIATHMKEVLRELGEDPGREGLLSTPLRAEKALKFLTSGYDADIESIVNGAVFNEKCDEMVVVKDIEFFSMCEHHMLPFYGKAHVAYIPKNKIIGLSKIPRLVDVFARRLQVQERMTQQIAECIREVLDPVGVGVITEARHFCMMMRGVEKQHSSTTSSAMLGAFRHKKDSRDEFLSHVRHNGLYNW